MVGLFKQIISSSSTAAFYASIIGVMTEYDDLDCAMMFFDVFQYAYPGTALQADIQNHDIRLQLTDTFNGPGFVYRLTDHLDFRHIRQNRLQAIS